MPRLRKFALGKPPLKVVIEPVIAPVVAEADNVTASVPVSAFAANKLRRMLEIADDITNAELSRKHISSTKPSLDGVTYTGGKLLEMAATYGLGTIQVLEGNRGNIKFQTKVFRKRKYENGAAYFVNTEFHEIMTKVKKSL